MTCAEDIILAQQNFQIPTILKYCSIIPSYKYETSRLFFPFVGSKGGGVFSKKKQWQWIQRYNFLAPHDPCCSIVSILLLSVAITARLNFVFDKNMCCLTGQQSMLSNHFRQAFREGCSFVSCCCVLARRPHVSVTVPLLVCVHAHSFHIIFLFCAFIFCRHNGWIC